MEDKQITIKENDLPKNYIIGNFGCLNCEWQYTHCERYNKEEVDTFTFHPDGICQKRKQWLLNLIPPYPNNKKPSMSQLRLDINKSLGDKRQRKILHYIEQIDTKLVELRLDPEENAGQIRNDEERRRKLHNDWVITWKELCKLDEQQLHRETPKIVKHEHENLSHSKFQSYIHGIDEDKIIDAKFENIEDLDE